MIIRKGQLFPKRLGHITIHDKARACLKCGAMIDWTKNRIMLLSPGWVISMKKPNRRRMNNGTWSVCHILIKDLHFFNAVNHNRIFLGFAPIPTRTNLFANPPSLLHSTDIEYPETKYDPPIPFPRADAALEQ